MKLVLINMPFADLSHPSLALTQLQSVIRSECGPAVSVDLLYLNHDFGELFGVELYQEIVWDPRHFVSGFGDWFFRSLAFPAVADNAPQYWRRFYPRADTDTVRFRERTMARRERLHHFLGDLIDRYRIADADVVGFTSMFAQSVACFALAAQLKQRRPGIVTIMGGANCEAIMGRAIAATIPQIDFVCSGPGLISGLEIVRRLANPNTASRDPIPGVFASRSGRYAALAPPPPNELGVERPIDEIVALDYDAFLDTLERRFPNGSVTPTLDFETSRGCWWGQKAHCTFCGLNGLSMAYRAMQPTKALAQFHSLFRYAPRCASFNAVDNILPKHYLAEVLPLMDPPDGATIFYEVKADLSEADTHALVRAGVRRVQPGIESLATSTLKLMRKGTSAFTSVRLLMYCQLSGLDPAWNLLMGFPDETADVFEKYVQDIPLLTHLPPPAGAFPVRFDRFSPYFGDPERYGLDLHPLDMYEFIYPLSPEVRTDIAYYFADHRYDAPYLVAMASMLPHVRRVVNLWKERYNGSDGAAPAALTFHERDGQQRIWDSRTRETHDIELTPASAWLLRRLETPTQVHQIASSAPSDVDVELAFRTCRSHGWLFEEGERAVSLVLPRSSTRQLQRSTPGA